MRYWVELTIGVATPIRIHGCRSLGKISSIDIPDISHVVTNTEISLVVVN